MTIYLIFYQKLHQFERTIQKKFICTAICIFSFMAPLGVTVGILITTLGDNESSEGPIVILESLATGTFLYVTFLELVPHEFIGNIRNGPRKGTGRFFKNKKIHEQHDSFLVSFLVFAVANLCQSKRLNFYKHVGDMLYIYFFISQNFKMFTSKSVYNGCWIFYDGPNTVADTRRK
jgi:hypothetical protein